jgi:PAS domain S-box-containing protein
MSLPGAHGRVARAALAIAVLALCVHVGHTLFGFGGTTLAPVFDRWLLVAINIGATVICASRALAARGKRAAWVAMSVGLGSWTVGDAVFVAMYTQDPPTPSLADAFYIVLYPAMAVTLVLLVRSRVRDVRLWLDGVVAGLTLVGLAVALAFSHIEAVAGGGSLAFATTLAYAIGDLMLLGFVAAVFTMTGFRPGARWGLLGAGLMLASVADTIFSYQVTAGSYHVGTLLDSVWPAGLLLIATSAWAPPRSRTRTENSGRPAFGLAALFTATGVAVMIADHYARIPEAAVWLVASALLIRIARTALTFADMSRALSASQVAAALVESSDDAIFSVHRDGTIMSWNPGAVATFGHDPTVVGRPLGDLVDRACSDTLHALLATAANGRAVGGELAGRRADGQPIELGLSIAPIRDGSGRVTGLSVIAHDITGRRQVERAERANKAKSQFLSRMSHELRTPLNAVLGFGQLLALRDLEPDAKEDTEHILKAGEHLLELINETLEISHIESGRLSLTIEPVDVATIAAEVVELMAPLNATRDITVAIDHASVSGWVAADRQRLKQVLLNLLSNAIKFNVYGGRVDVRGERRDGDRFAIAVTDTGAGIDAGDMPRLFSPFERLRAREEDVEGSGLGLALSKGLMEAMEGTLTAASEPGAGSTFTLELPACPAGRDKPLVPREAPLPRIAPEGDRDGEMRTVLYVEDNRSNRELMEQIFATCDDLALLTAEYGALGVEFAAEHRPDLILLDVNLPDIDGRAVLERLRSHPGTRSIPVIAVSADATQGQIDVMLAHGALDYLTKPIDIARLMRAIDDALLSAPAG